MAKKNPADVLTCDWNPVVGCKRISAGCRKCWFLDGIFPWQQRLKNIPADVESSRPYVMAKRMTVENLKPKNGIVGVVQHGDLFWDQITDATIKKVLDIVDEVAALEKNRGNQTKYVLWTKRAKRMADSLNARYPEGTPDHLAVCVSIENQKIADDRLPHLLRFRGRRFIMIEPMLGPIDLKDYIKDVDWVVLGSETGGANANPMDPDWARKVRDQAVAAKIPFFIKQIGKNHRKPERKLDGRTWDEFPDGFRK